MRRLRHRYSILPHHCLIFIGQVGKLYLLATQPQEKGTIAKNIKTR